MPRQKLWIVTVLVQCFDFLTNRDGKETFGQSIYFKGIGTSKGKSTTLKLYKNFG